MLLVASPVPYRGSCGLRDPLGSLGLMLAILPDAGAAEANDLFRLRSRIPCDRASITSTTIGATREPGEPLHAEVLGGASL